MNILKDSFGRRFPYIRLSISDVCNFKCGYCLPNGYKIDKSDNRTFINTEEIGRLARALSELGVSKIRLTGGEPTIRKDFLEIIKIIKKNSGIKKTVITTNGYKLDKIYPNPYSLFTLLFSIISITLSIYYIISQVTKDD